MNISPEEAQASLVAIHQTRTKLNKLSGMSGYFLMIWGLVWFFGCLANQFMPLYYVGWVWGPLSILGSVLSGILGAHMGRQVHSTIAARIGFFFLALFVFSGFWFLLLHPVSVEQGSLFFLSLMLFGGVVAGIMTRSVASIIGSLAILVLALPGYYLLPAYFFLWLAVFCGLPWFSVGLVLRLRWR